MDGEWLRRTLVRLEEARLILTLNRLPIGTFTKDDLFRFFEILRVLHDDAVFLETLARIPYRAIGSRVRAEREVGPGVNDFKDLIDRVEAELGLARGESVQLELSALQEIIPSQKVAPAQFDVADDRLIIIHQTFLGEKGDRENIASARSRLLEQGKNIIDELQRSNCDRRLLSTVENLQLQLEENGNIINLGLTNILCAEVCNAFEQELPDAVSALLRGHTKGIDLFVGQYPEWNRFIENARESVLEKEDVERLESAATKIVSSLERSPDLADPEVPQTIKRLNELLHSPNASGQRVAFAILRTLENLIAKVFSYGSELISQTAKKAIDGVSTAVGKAVAVALILLILDGAVGIVPTVSKIPESRWLKTAIEVISKNIPRQ